MKKSPDVTATHIAEKTTEGASATPRARVLGIADIARMAEVSIATVSRSIANPSRVNPETRERVLEIEHTLYPDTLAKIERGEIPLPPQ